MSHTPGPWTYSNDMGCPMVWAGSMRICDVRGWGHLTGAGALNLPEEKAAAIQDANGRLITAAPDLLQALKFFQKCMAHGAQPRALSDSLKLAQAAIAKAEERCGGIVREKRK